MELKWIKFCLLTTPPFRGKGKGFTHIFTIPFSLYGILLKGLSFLLKT